MARRNSRRHRSPAAFLGFVELNTFQRLGQHGHSHGDMKPVESGFTEVAEIHLGDSNRLSTVGEEGRRLGRMDALFEMSVAPVERHLQYGMHLRQGGLLLDPQTASHGWGNTLQPRAQLHRADFIVVYHVQTLPLTSFNRQSGAASCNHGEHRSPCNNKVVAPGLKRSRAKLPLKTVYSVLASPFRSWSLDDAQLRAVQGRKAAPAGGPNGPKSGVGPLPRYWVGPFARNRVVPFRRNQGVQ